MSAMRIIAGHGDAQSKAILTLAMRLSDRAWALGLKVASFRASHSRRSASRYMTIIDAQHHSWTVRISNHRRPLSNKHDAPHLDFISHDGHSGFDQAAGWLEKVALGQIDWEQAKPNGRCRRQRRRGR